MNLFNKDGAIDSTKKIKTRESWEALAVLMQNPKMIEEYQILPDLFEHEFHKGIFEKLFNVVKSYDLKDGAKWELGTIFNGESLTSEELDFVSIIRDIKIPHPELLGKLFHRQFPNPLNFILANIIRIGVVNTPIRY